MSEAENKISPLGVYITQDLKIYVKFYHAAFLR